ncbi:peroxidase 24-like [Salvia splendens]|uniref:peroxidase 24-like n=1 Tax=Salvia splendens TaxID=180675 RepID=UPI0011021D9A|nr:peroxidase 24-like [Salvia splendens]XP_042056442.1 peroxidase 24-like [Salvia splendens]
MKMRSFLSITLLLLAFLVAAAGAKKSKAPIKPVGLIPNYYKVTGTCKQAEQLVRQVVREKVRNDPTLGAKLLRVHYHDCFVKGCDASILLNTVGTNQSEKDARPNLSLGGFEVIDEIKTRIEKVCTQKVSCADILARDAVSFPFKEPLWDVLTGRKDGRVSLISNVNGNLPSAFSNFSTLQTIYSNKGLDINDLVALSGAHTIGVSHCGAFSRRLYNFTGKGDADPSLDPAYAEFLRKQCPNPASLATVVGMDPNSTLTFDTHYFAALKKRQGLFQSDAALLTDATSAGIVRRFQSREAFFKQFAKSMVKMGAIEVLVGDAGEIRKDCRFIN